MREEDCRRRRHHAGRDQRARLHPRGQRRLRQPHHLKLCLQDPAMPRDRQQTRRGRITEKISQVSNAVQRGRVSEEEKKK